MEGLDFENIMTGDEINNLFIQPPEEKEIKEKEDELDVEETEDDIKVTDKETTEVNPETIFQGEGKPESVGSEEESQDDQEDTSLTEDDSSPNTNFYSSIAHALHEEGIFPDLNDEVTKNIKTPEDFAKAVEDQITAKFDERQRRIDEALTYNVEPTEIKGLETTLNYLDSIKDDVISDETEKGVTIRQQLIFQDSLNRGYDKERAQREVKKSIDAGTDIEDARDALMANKKYYSTYYDNLIKQGKEEHEKSVRQREKEAEEFRKTLLEDKKAFGEISLDKKTRQKIYNNITKPAYKDTETGEYFTVLQKYEMENKADFKKNVGLIFTLTDGFKNLEGLIKDPVKREVKKGLRELENTLNNTSRTSDGNLKYVGGVDEDPQSFSNNWDLDI